MTWRLKKWTICNKSIINMKIKVCIITFRHFFFSLEYSEFSTSHSWLLLPLIQMDLATCRHYLGQPPRMSAEAVMQDACVHQVHGARILLDLCINVRSNRQTRRSFDEVSNALVQRNPPRWLGVLKQQVWSLYRLLLTSHQYHVTSLNSYADASDFSKWCIYDEKYHYASCE